MHIYATIRIKVSGVEADNHEDAIDKAANSFDIYQLLSLRERGGYGNVEAENAEELDSYHVDEVGDEERKQSRSYLYDGKTLIEYGINWPPEVVLKNTVDKAVGLLNSTDFQVEDLCHLDATTIEAARELQDFMIRSGQLKGPVTFLESSREEGE